MITRTLFENHGGTVKMLFEEELTDKRVGDIFRFHEAQLLASSRPANKNILGNHKYETPGFEGTNPEAYFMKTLYLCVSVVSGFL